MTAPQARPGPNTPRLDRLTRQLAASHDDGKIRDALGRTKPLVRDATSGEVMPAFYYRLVCGHILVVFTTPLPAGTLELYCGEDACRRYVDVVEHLAAVVDDPATAGGCDVCGGPAPYSFDGRRGCLEHLEVAFAGAVRLHRDKGPRQR